MGERERAVTDGASGTHGSRGRLSPCLRTVTTAWVFTMDTEWRAAPHTGAKGRGYPGPKRKPTLTGPGGKTAVLEDS